MSWYDHRIVLPHQDAVLTEQIGVDIIELASSTSSFWSSTGAVYRKLHEKELVTTESHLRDTILRKPAARVSWLIALFLLCYVGMEVSTGGWIVSYEINVRHGAPFESGLTSTWFWLGITLGRMILGFVTPRVGIKVSIAVSRLSRCIYSLGFRH